MLRVTIDSHLQQWLFMKMKCQTTEQRNYSIPLTREIPLKTAIKDTALFAYNIHQHPCMENQLKLSDFTKVPG